MTDKTTATPRECDSVPDNEEIEMTELERFVPAMLTCPRVLHRVYRSRLQ